MTRTAMAEASALSMGARCVGDVVYERLRSAKQVGSVHSSYRGAVNVQTSEGLVCLVPLEAGRGPLNINLDAEFLTKIGGLPVGSPVAMGADEISFENGISVSLSGADQYVPTGLFRRNMLQHRLISRNISLAKEVAIVAGRLAGVGELMIVLEGPSRELRLNPFSAAALPNVRRLIQSVEEIDFAGAEGASRGLVGLGVGLTPSADDMLAGFMVSLVLGSKNGLGGEDVTEFARRISDTSEGRTTALSREFLNQAASGRANERLTRLVEALYTGTAAEVRGSTLDVIGIGETSGTDMVTGVVLGTRAKVALKEARAA